MEAPGAGAYRLTIHNPNVDNVLVGVRVHVGGSSPSHTPTEVRVGGGGRVVRLEDGARRWHDIPLTPAESMQVIITINN